MSTDTELLEQNQKLRYEILRTMYNETYGSYRNPEEFEFTPTTVSAALQLPRPNTLIAMQYLNEKGLIRKKIEIDGDPIYVLAHQGILEIEKSIEFPKSPTEHFMTSVVQNFHAPVGSIQNGPNSTAQVIQNNNIGVSLTEVLSLIDEIQIEALSKLPPEKQNEVKEELEVLKEEVSSKEKNSKRLKAIWKGIQTGTLATIDVATKLATLAEKLKSFGLLDS